jgi:hypothetical protein
MTKYVINTAPDLTGIAPPHHEWSAWFGDYDVGTVCGTGFTEHEAIADLVLNHDMEVAA